MRPSAAVLTAVALAVAAPHSAQAEPSPAPSAGSLYVPIEPGTGVLPTQSGLSARLAGVLGGPNLGGSVAASVVDVSGGQSLYSASGGQALTPASTTKVLTAAAVLSTIGSQARLRTRVVELSAPSLAPTPAAATPSVTGPAQAPPRRLVLVGGGDPLLSSLPPGAKGIPAYPARAYLGDLVEATAKAMKDAGVAEIELGYDDSLFPGERAAKTWSRGYTIDVVGPVSALSVDQGRVGPLDGGRVADPSARTAAMFAAQLRAAGLKVLGTPAKTDAPPDARSVAEIESAPMSAIVEYMLVVSDNDVAEALARHVAVHAQRPATFDEGTAAMLAAIRALGVDTTGSVVHDGSGLSRSNRIPPRVLAATLAAAGTNQVLRPMVAGLAVAGVNGTLGLHFFLPASAPGRGLVRGKTGSLQGVVSLAGLVPTADGRLLAFDVVADNVPGGYGRPARQVWERFATELVRCGC
ncbi:MAG: D-alanyl-D-alanine carboxypeptidase/D-alanyl-D-alanine endopeptidase [Sporichthyaceae bacterium]